MNVTLNIVHRHQFIPVIVCEDDLVANALETAGYPLAGAEYWAITAAGERVYPWTPLIPEMKLDVSPTHSQTYVSRKDF